MLKKTVLGVTTLSLAMACNIRLNTLNTTDIGKISGGGNAFSIKSTTNPNEVKKDFLPVTRLSKQKGKEKDDDKKEFKFNFNASSNDLKRSFILNITNGAGGLARVGNLEVKVNGIKVIFNHDEDLNDLEDIVKIKKKICKDDYHDDDSKKSGKNDGKDKKSNTQSTKTIPDCSILFNNFFNKKTESLSIRLENIKEGINTLEVKIKDERSNFGLDISIDGFLESYKIEGAIHSLIPRDDEMKKAEYKKGLLGIKFLEGMKVRLITDSNNNQKFVDLNGTSLEGLNRLLKNLDVKYIAKSINLPEDELDQDEIKVETSRGIDVPNLNLFFRLGFDETSDIWALTDQIKSLPYVEESYPYFVEKEAIDLPNDPELNGILFFNDGDKNKCMSYLSTPPKLVNLSYLVYNNSNSSKVVNHTSCSPIDKSDWLKYMHIMKNDMDSGAWIRTQGSSNIKSAVIDYGSQIASLGLGQKTHEDLSKIEAISNIKKDTISNPDLNLNHGTPSVGVIGATGKNSIGISGVSFNSPTLFIQGSGKYNSGKKDNDNNDIFYPVDSDCKGNGQFLLFFGCNGIPDSLYLAKKNGANIINLETDSPPYTREQGDPEVRSTISSLVEKGIIIIVPAGNNNNNDIRKMKSKDWFGKEIIIDTPDTGSIIVSGLSLDASKRHSGLKYDSITKKNIDIKYNYGVSKSGGENNLYTTGGHGVDVGGPAEEIWTTWFDEKNPNEINKYGRFGGTSGASPALNGIVNLILSLNPKLTPYEVRKILRETRQDDLLLGNDKVTGSSPTAGMVNAWAALNKVSPFTTSSLPASNSYGFKIQGTTMSASNVVDNNSKIPVNTQTAPNTVLGVSIQGDKSNATVSIDNKIAPIVGHAPNTIAFTVPQGTTTGVKNVNVSTSNGNVTIQNAVDIQSNTTNSELITNSNTRVYLNFNESNEITANDSTSNHNNATIYGNYSWLNNSGKEKLSLNGIDSYVKIPETASLDITKSMTVEMVFKMNSEIPPFNQIRLAQKSESRSGLYLNSSWSLIYNKDFDAFELDLNSGNYRSLVLFGTKQNLVVGKDYYIQAGWDYENKKFNFVLNGVELEGTVLQGNFPPAFPDPNSFGEMNISTMPITLGAIYYAFNTTDPLSFGYYADIALGKFALHSEYRTPQQGIQTSQNLGLAN